MPIGCERTGHDTLAKHIATTSRRGYGQEVFIALGRNLRRLDDGSFVVHGVLLHDDYAKMPTLFRPEAEAQQYFPLMIFAHVILAAAFAWIYARGVEAKPSASAGDPLWVWPSRC